MQGQAVSSVFAALRGIIGWHRGSTTRDFDVYVLFSLSVLFAGTKFGAEQFEKPKRKYLSAHNNPELHSRDTPGMKSLLSIQCAHHALHYDSRASTAGGTLYISLATSAYKYRCCSYSLLLGWYHTLKHVRDKHLPLLFVRPTEVPGPPFTPPPRTARNHPSPLPPLPPPPTHTQFKSPLRVACLNYLLLEE